ncbi:unnamed protein product [Sympodiomycopsis kandeliae]
MNTRPPRKKVLDRSCDEPKPKGCRLNPKLLHSSPVAYKDKLKHSKWHHNSVNTALSFQKSSLEPKPAVNKTSAVSSPMSSKAKAAKEQSSSQLTFTDWVSRTQSSSLMSWPSKVAAP